uniref:valine--tRNA ligase n=1 Tax=Rhizophora mucronata TaxID=61149 RepID=A0A2P2M189_RHIMU
MQQRQNICIYPYHWHQYVIFPIQWFLSCCCILMLTLITRYIEASKARLYQSNVNSVASVAQAVLLYVFENVLKLLHPFMPFVTEELWQAVPKRKEALIVSSWPQILLPQHTSSIKKFENFQALTKAIRNARAEYSVEPAKRISASIVASKEVTQYISGMQSSLYILLPVRV